MGYGNVQIQTAGARREFIFKEIPDPYKTKEIITQAQINFLRKINEKGIEPPAIDDNTT